MYSMGIYDDGLFFYGCSCDMDRRIVIFSRVSKDSSLYEI